MNTLLIVGTEAQVGKTVVLSALVAYWQRYCNPRQLGVMKPIDCHAPGHNPDHELFIRLFQLNQTVEEITPFSFQSTAPLPMLTERSGHPIDLEQIWHQLQKLQQQRDFVLLEAWGGLGSPLTARTTVADLAWDWQLPTLLVVPVQPGAVTQAVTNVALARQSRVHLKGIVLNAVQPCSPEDWQEWAPIDLIQSVTQKPVLGCVPHFDNPESIDQLAKVAGDWDLERLIPELSNLVVG